MIGDEQFLKRPSTAIKKLMCGRSLKKEGFLSRCESYFWESWAYRIEEVILQLVCLLVNRIMQKLLNRKGDAWPTKEIVRF